MLVDAQASPLDGHQDVVEPQEDAASEQEMEDSRGEPEAGEGKQGAQQLKLARLLVALVGKDNLIFNGGAFWMWKGNVWATVDDREMKQLLHKMLAGKQKVSKGLVDAVLDLARTEAFRPGHQFDQDKSGINVQNGTLHWTGQCWELRPHCREDFRTAILPVVYDPVAQAVRFKLFLAEIFEPDSDSADKARLIMEAIGYTLTTSTEYERFFVLTGDGANGKSVLLYVLRELVGKEACSSVAPSQFERLFQRASLRSKLANIVTELSVGENLPDAATKAIVTGERMSAEVKFRDPFDFEPFCTIWLATNHIPGTKDFSEALFRRAVIVPFGRIFDPSEQDRKLKYTLVAELPGILNMALDAYAGVLLRGGFTEPASVLEALKAWKADTDPVRGFVAEEVLTCEECKREKLNRYEVVKEAVSGGPDSNSRCNDCFEEGHILYKAFETYCANTGVRFPPKRKEFTQRLVKLTGGKLDRDNTRRMVRGVQLRNPFAG
ncbi:hypothetical protein NNJEOMEG_00047 [Fundidesulfovibrio magnetotacticus]|uniref:SF3 helicase domain-containing protein n=1 Tax=Fundidesulfovibrio magnetotacticus TaxID=2730080 RepID=A0A6V8LVF6_9BACT|nr:phage/plasmid primase, P4 family [Fundidesulfovibrio magnetotacticus]GFK92225.1 hypothetical protein NNJEOMEG_00047 [Fundidesulfovibrio magnetotacticus]